MIVAHHVGWEFEFVTLRHHPHYTNLWGYVQYSRPLETRDDLDDWAPVFLAGQFGEALLLGFAGPGASQDTTVVLEQARSYLDNEADAQAFVRKAFDRARQIVASRGAEVRALAEELVERETIDRAGVARIIAGVG